jgi:hypothetical protein
VKIIAFCPFLCNNYIEGNLKKELLEMKQLINMLFLKARLFKEKDELKKTIDENMRYSIGLMDSPNPSTVRYGSASLESYTEMRNFLN